RVRARPSVPPYCPVSPSGLSTRGLSGKRFSTGGSLPSLTSCASCGASLYPLVVAAAVGAAAPTDRGAVVAAGLGAAVGAAVAARAAPGAVVGGLGPRGACGAQATTPPAPPP